MNHYSNPKDRKKSIIRTLIVVLALAAVMIFGFYMMSDEDIHYSDNDDTNTKTGITIDGKEYVPRSNILSYLFIGVDQDVKVEEMSEDTGTGQSDVLILLIIDKVNNTYAILPVNRDTVTYVDSLDDDNHVLSGTEMQLAFAHASGDGKKGSCENTMKAVSGLLRGQRIDGYYAMNLHGIGIVNHDLGGVTVTVKDDFSMADSSLIMGETITLTDEQAETFVRSRMSMDDPTNENRMGRQSVFIESAKPVFFDKTNQDSSFPLDLYDDLSEYAVTSLSKNDISKISKALLKNEDLGTFNIEGESSLDDYGFLQFIPDEKSLDNIIVKLFYEPR